MAAELLPGGSWAYHVRCACRLGSYLGIAFMVFFVMLLIGIFWCLLLPKPLFLSLAASLGRNLHLVVRSKLQVMVSEARSAHTGRTTWWPLLWARSALRYSRCALATVQLL